MTTLTPFQQTTLNHVQMGILLHSKTTPPQRNTLHALRELKLVDFRAGEDDFEWFAVPQETETQEATAVVPVESEFIPRKGLRVAFQRAFASDKTWYEGTYWGVYAGNPKLHQVRFGGINEPAWHVRSLSGQVAKPAAVEGQIITPKPETSMEALANEQDEITFPTPAELGIWMPKAFFNSRRQTINPNFNTGLVYDQPQPAPFILTAEDVVTCDFCEERPRAQGSTFCAQCDRDVVEFFMPERFPASEEPVNDPAAKQDIFDGLADFTPARKPAERKVIDLDKLGVSNFAFKPVDNKLITTPDRLFSRKGPYSGKVWLVGKWERRQLALTHDGMLLMIDGVLVWEVRPRQIKTLEIVFNAWAGNDWNKELAGV